MSYYPLLNIPSEGLEGWVTLCNFAPNNFEKVDRAEKRVYVTWLEDNLWHHHQLGAKSYGEAMTFAYMPMHVLKDRHT